MSSYYIDISCENACTCASYIDVSCEYTCTCASYKYKVFISLSGFFIIYR